MLLLNSGRKTRSYSSSQRYYWNFCWKCRSYGLTGIEINSHLGPSQAVVKSKIWEFTSLRWRPRRLHSLSLCWKTRCMVNAWWAEFMCMCILINVGGYGESGQIQLCDQDTWWMWLWLYKCTKKKKKVHKGTERCDGTNRVLLLTGNRKQQKTQADNHKTASIIKCCII